MWDEYVSPTFAQPLSILCHASSSTFPTLLESLQNAAYYENAAFVCVVFDVSNRDSFESCGRWLQGVRAALPSSATPLPGVLVANKSDLREGGINSRAVVSTEVKSAMFGKRGGVVDVDKSSG